MRFTWKTVNIQGVLAFGLGFHLGTRGAVLYVGPILLMATWQEHLDDGA